MKIAGQRRGEAYPGRGAGGSDLASIPPLSRQRFIDGGTTSPGQGSSAQPFATIASFIASRGNASVADATANYVGWVMPALNGYAENVAFPPYASTELRGDSFSAVPGSGTVITGNVTWANVAGAHAATDAIVAMHNLTVTGTFTVTDDGVVPGLVLFGCDEAGKAGTEILGGFDSSTTTALVEVEFYNALLAGIGLTAGAASSSAAVVIADSSVSGGVISAKALFAYGCILAPTAITVFGTTSFFGCTFNAAVTLTAGGPVTFDGPSWRSFVEAGGARGAGTAVLAVGGYSGASVEGADLTGASTNVSLNGTGATAGFTGEHSGNHYSTSNGTPTLVTLKTGGGELPGDTMLITKTDLGANALVVKNNAAVTIGTIPALSRGSVLAQYNGTDWVFVQGGSLAA